MTVEVLTRKDIFIFQSYNQSTNLNNMSNQSIMSSINQTKIRPKWHFWLLDILKITVITICLLFAIFNLVILINDIKELSQEFSQTNLLGILVQSLLEVVIIIFLSTFISFVVYKQSDWKLAYNSQKLIVSMVFGVLSCALLVSYLLPNLNDWQSVLFYRQSGNQSILNELNSRRIWFGSIAGLKNDRITINNKFGSQTFTCNNKCSQKLDNKFKIIVIKYNDNKTITVVQ